MGIMVELEQAKKLANLVNELESIIRILAVGDVIKDNMMERVKEIKEILKSGGKLREVKDDTVKSN